MTGIVFTLWVFACVYVCVIMAKCGPGDSYCSGNYQRGGFESFARCLPATTATAGIVFTLWDCVSSWPNVLLENLSVAGNTSEAIFSTLQVFMCLWTDFVDAIVSQPCKNQSRNICVVEIKWGPSSYSWVCCDPWVLTTHAIICSGPGSGCWRVDRHYSWCAHCKMVSSSTILLWKKLDKNLRRTSVARCINNAYTQYHAYVLPAHKNEQWQCVHLVHTSDHSHLILNSCVWHCARR